MALVESINQVLKKSTFRGKFIRFVKTDFRQMLNKGFTEHLCLLSREFKRPRDF